MRVFKRERESARGVVGVVNEGKWDRMRWKETGRKGRHRTRGKKVIIIGGRPGRVKLT